MEENEPLVSVVIPTKDSEGEIRRCLNSIKLQSYPKIEIIVVDSESRDMTREIAEEYGAKVINIKSGRSQARNMGAKISKGKFILFVDSDQELDKDLISKAVKATILKNFDAVRFPKIIRGESFFGKVRSVESLLNYRVSSRNPGVPRFYKKSTFLKIGGYDEKLDFGEDRELWECLCRSGYKIGIVDIPIFEVENSFLKRLVKNYKYGKQFEEYQKKSSNALNVLFESVNIECMKNVSSTSEALYFLFAMMFKMLYVLAFLIGRIIDWMQRKLNGGN